MSEAEVRTDRGSVRLTKTASGITWSVTVGLGSTHDEVEAARVVAETIAARLDRDVKAAVVGRGKEVNAHSGSGAPAGAVPPRPGASRSV